MSRIKWVLAALFIIGLGCVFYYLGGERPLERVETPVTLETGAA